MAAMKATYDIVSGKTPEILKRNVNERLKAGWSLYEGLVFAEGRYFQIMTFYDSPSPLPLFAPRYMEECVPEEVGHA